MQQKCEYLTKGENPEHYLDIAIHGLKQPLNATPPSVKPYHQHQYLQEDAAALPGLKAFMQRAAAHAKPVSMYGFPLTLCPPNRGKVTFRS